jgi:hypothetical protein
VTAVLYLALGAPALNPAIWVLLALDVPVYLLLFAWWNRRHEVGPHLASSLAGTVLTTIVTPVYVTALVSSVLRRRAGFTVTPKANARSTDGLRAFRANLGWAAFQALLVTVAALNGYGWWLWPALGLLMCLAPPALWLVTRREPGAAPVAKQSAAPDRTAVSP